MDVDSAPLRYRSFSIIANLSELESFILHDPSAQSLYQEYLAFVSVDGRKSNHVPFFADIVNISERMSFPKAPSIDYFRAELYMIFEQYFLEDSDLLLDIPREKLDQVRRNVERNVTMLAFKPAIKTVVRDLAFIYLDSFMNSAIFKDYKVNVLEQFRLNDVPQMAVKDKESSMKLKKFFGDKFVQSKAHATKNIGDQPNHIKEYKLNKIFGERVGIEKATLLTTEDIQEREYYKAAAKRRDRKLHVFFGNYFEVEDTMYSERVRARSVSDAQEYRNQPTHVKNFRLARFFGARPPEGGCRDKSSVDDTEIAVARNKKQRLNRFFGERIDPEKEATSITFAVQPENVKGVTLKKFFGESASHTIKFGVASLGGGNTWPACRTAKSRAKLEKIFGPYTE